MQYRNEQIRIFSPEQMRRIDRRTIDAGYFSGIGLMENAGRAAAAAVLEKFGSVSYHILTGSGNNGGDGFVIAAALAEKIGAEKVVLHCAGIPQTGDALLASGKVPQEIRSLESFCVVDVPPGAVVIDCLLGTGFRPPLRPLFAQWIREINACRLCCPVVAVDIPSGLNGEDGTAVEAVQADLTLTFAALKSGLILNAGAKYCGKIRVLDIGIPETVMTEEPDSMTITDAASVRRLLLKQRQAYDTYKQKRGHVLVIGGSVDYPSAPFLSAEAALRGGAGMVTVAIPGKTEIFCPVPKALIVRRGSEDGYFRKDSVAEILKLLPKMDAVVIGPGMTAEPGCMAFFMELLPQITCPVLLDADALNLLALNRDLFRCLTCSTVLTPHAGELARLENAGFDSMACPAVLVKKGPYSAVMQGTRCAQNLSGSPALATAGSGDVLSGVIAAFLGQKYDPFDAARIGVYLHGKAGERGAGLIADDLLPEIGNVLQKISL